MARIFYGNRAKVDRAVLDAARTLPDDYWVLAEFDLNGRNIDWLVVRPVPDDRPADTFAVIFITELKRTQALLEGAENGRWRERRNGTWSELIPTNMADENWWMQTLNTLNAFCEWLHNNQRRFLTNPQQLYPPAAFRAWPNLLILSDPPGTIHQLPLRPQNRFGHFRYDLAEWLAAVRDWQPRVGVPLTAAEVTRLVAVLGLREIAPHHSANATPPGHTAPDAPALSPADPDLAWLPGFVRWATDLEARVRVLEARLAAREATPPSPLCPPKSDSALDAAKTLLARSGIAPALAQTAAKPAKATTLATETTASPSTVTRKVATLSTTSPARGAAAPATTDRALTPAERDLLTAALAALCAAQKQRTFSVLFNEMRHRNGGISFKQQHFNGFGTARALLDRAVREGVIRYGPPDATGMPTVYFPHETIPPAEAT